MKIKLAALFCALLLLAGCTAAPAASLSAAPAQENLLVVYTSHKEAVYGPILREFEERTGIWVEVVTGGTNELLERIAAERDDPACDVMFGGGVESLLTYSSCFAPCASTAPLKDGLRPQDDLWTPFSCLPVVIIYNPKLVGEGQITGWSDLLRPAWRGRIAFADPSVSGSSYTAVMTMLSCLPGDLWENLGRFYANVDGCILPDSGDVVKAVASGSLPVGVCLEEAALKQQAQGAQLRIIYPAEGTSSLPDGTALIANAPHRDNALAFLAFTQSEDVQQLVVERLRRRSVRADIAEPDALPSAQELRLIPYDIQWAADSREEVLRRWAALGQEAAS